ncbi:MAG TPA: exonuclease domain-containing protein [Solirubrobacteraceae bacterium]
MPATHSGPIEVARLIGQRPPFHLLAPEALGGLISEIEIEFHRAGSTISGERLVRVVHSGAVDDGGRLLGPGAALPAGSRATAAQDSLCYRIPATAAGVLADHGSSGPKSSAPCPRPTRHSLRSHWTEASWCAIDLELTGLDPRNDHIVAIGAVPIERGRVVLGRAMYTLVRSSRPSGRGALLAHNLRPEDLEDAPAIDDALELLRGALSTHHPVFHTAVIERSFLGPLFARRRARLPESADTQVLGRLWLLQRGDPATAGLPLTRLARLLGQLTEEPHHALADALMTALAFIALAEHLDASESQTVGRLIRAGEGFLGARRFGPA